MAAVASLVLAVGAGIRMDASPATAHHQPWKIGTEPYIDITWSAFFRADQCAAANVGNIAAAMMAPIWSEAGGHPHNTPSPMSHGRWDLNSNLANGTSYWYPGIGLWQLDSAGMGRPLAAWQRILTATAAERVADHVIERFCSGSGSALNRARRAWGWNPSTSSFTTWYACNEDSKTRCDTTFNAIYNPSTGGLKNLQQVPSVTRYGGMKQHRCRHAITGTTYWCYWIRFANAEGDTGFMGAGSNPVPRTYYSSGQGSDIRDWLAIDQGGNQNKRGSRNMTMDGRENGALTWLQGIFFCDTTRNVGNCTTSPK